MATRKYLPTQRQKAKAALPFSAIISRDRQGRPRVITTPGSSGHRYQQILRRPDGGGLSVECTHVTDLGPIAPCKGNSNGSICYHALAALTLAARDAGKAVTFCYDQPAAERLSRLGGTPFRARSFQGQGEIWGVVK